MANQPLPPSYMAYDRTIVVFSPDGRILQVEYARQMVKNGATSVGIRLKDAVILGTVKISMDLAVTESYKKIYDIDDHIAAVSSGSLADARDIIKQARVRAQVHKMTYGEPISTHILTNYICERKHLVTQYAGVRPYGVGMLVGGVDDTGPHLYETEPSGTNIEWKAQAIGRGAKKAKKTLEKGYDEEMSVEDGLELMVKTLKESEKEATEKTLELVIIRKDETERLTPERVKKAQKKK